MSRLGLWSVAALAALTVTQFAVLLVRATDSVGPVVGEPLPAWDVTVVSDESELAAGTQEVTELLTRNGSCGVLVYVSTRCYYCRRMRAWWPAAFREWSDSVGGGVNAVWIGTESADELERFMAESPIDGVRVAQVEDWQGFLGSVAIFV